MVRPSTLFSPQRNSLLQEQIDSRPEGVYGTVCSLLVVDGRDPLARAWAPLLFKLKQADMSSVVVAESASKAAALQQLGPDVSFIQLDRLEHHRPPGGGRLPELPRDPSGGNPRYAEGVVCLRPDLSEAARQAVGHLPREIFGNMVLMDRYECLLSMLVWSGDAAMRFHAVLRQLRGGRSLQEQAHEDRQGNDRHANEDADGEPGPPGAAGSTGP